MKDGGRLVPDAIADEIYRLAQSSMQGLITGIILHPSDLTWEARLAIAIEQNSVRNRLRHRRQALAWLIRDVPRRLRNARAALAGEWEAEDDW